MEQLAETMTSPYDCRDSSIRSMRLKLTETTTREKHRLPFSGAVDDFERMMGGASADSNGVGPVLRKKDSLFVLEGVMKLDSAELVRTMDTYLIPTLRVMQAGFVHGSPIRLLLNSFRPMCPEVRERKTDSLFLYRRVTDYIERDNQLKLNCLYQSIERYRLTKDKRGVEHYNSDAYCMRKRLADALWNYEKMKLPDGHSRRHDSLEIIRQFVEMDAKQRAAYEDHLAEQGPHVSSTPPKRRSSGWYGNGIEYSAGSGRH